MTQTIHHGPDNAHTMTLPMKTLVTTTLAVLLTGAPCATLAHDILVFPEWNDGTLSIDVKYGHPEDYQAITSEKLFRFDAVTPAGNRVNWHSKLKLDGLDLKTMQRPDWNTADGVTVLAAQYDNGYWSKNEAGETVNTSRLSYPKTTMASHNIKFGKALVATGPQHRGFDRVIGQKVELVPMVDPFSLKVGDTLPVAVRLNGKPYVGAGVEIGDSVTAIPEEKIARYKTDAKGIAQVPIGKPGWQVLGVDHEEKSPLQKLADKEKYTATLVFRLP